MIKNNLFFSDPMVLYPNTYDMRHEMDKTQEPKLKKRHPKETQLESLLW